MRDPFHIIVGVWCGKVVEACFGQDVYSVLAWRRRKEGRQQSLKYHDHPRFARVRMEAKRRALDEIATRQRIAEAKRHEVAKRQADEDAQTAVVQ